MIRSSKSKDAELVITGVAVTQAYATDIPDIRIEVELALPSLDKSWDEILESVLARLIPGTRIPVP